jgi:UDP-N-acetylmuramoyl-L-alanyl-D-glutamate--2,6-diaminopimelate ligase
METDAWRELLDWVAAGLMVRTDSRKIEPGEAFVAMPGVREPGTRFIPDALARGAGFVVAAPSFELDAVWPATAAARLVRRDDPVAALGELAGAYFKTNALTLKLAGVTGTNGKTTVSFLVEHLLTAVGLKVGVLGTVSYRWPGFCVDAKLTTPDCWMLHELLANMEKSDVDVVVMEVSSHALDQNRVAGLRFDAALITNVTQDHLDYHQDMERYFEAKSRLFYTCPKPDKVGVANLDDERCRKLARGVFPAMGFALKDTGEYPFPVVRGRILSSSAKGLHLEVRYKGKTWEIASPLIGEHNASNLLAAQTLALALGASCKDMRRLSDFKGVPGRLERVENPHGLDVFVDYAHTPDALVNVQKALRGLHVRRLVVVFGCGGNRDRTKRPLMARAVAEHADVAVLTSDNPRHEDPLAIMADARPGLERARGVIEEPDRAAAIRRAVELVEPGDVLLVAGKGHESYQQVGDEFRPFSDREATAAAIREVKG